MNNQKDKDAGEDDCYSYIVRRDTFLHGTEAWLCVRIDSEAVGARTYAMS